MPKKFHFEDDNGNPYPAWEQKKLGEVLNLHSGKDQKGFEDPNGKYPILATGGEIGRTNVPLCSKESVLIGRKGTIDKPQYMNSPFRTVDTLFYTTMKENVSAKYIFFIAQITKWKKLSEASGVPSLNSSIILNVPCPLPSLPEQEKIAEFFSALDERIDLIDNKVKLLKERKKGYLQRVFSGELAFTDDNGERYPAWEQKKLGEVATLKMGFTPSTDNTDFWQGDIPWLSIAGFNRKYIETGTKFISEEALGKKKVLPKGSLVMSFKLTLGKLAILKHPMVTNEAICSFEWINDITTSEFAFYALSSLKFEKFANRAAAGLTLNDKTLKLLPISLPSLPEQEKITEFFSALDEEIELNENKLTLLKEQKKGYLQGIFG